MTALSKEKLVWVTNIPSPYGLDLFEELQKRFSSYECHFIYTNASEDNREWSLGDHPIEHIHILHARILKLKGRTDTHYVHLPTNGLKRLLDELKPVCVFAWEYNPAALRCLSWCRKYSVRFIHVTEGTLYSERYIGKLQKMSRKKIIGSADACIACSTKAVEKLKYWHAKEDRIFLSLLTRDLTGYRNTAGTRIPGRILYVGSLIERKGVDLLLDALRYVPGEWELHIAGNGPEKDNLVRAAEDYGLDGRIHWLGFTEGDRLLKEYAGASLFVLPTREDCYGLVLVEALAAGIPIVSSKYADGAYDTVTDGVNGRIVDPFNARLFASAVEECLSTEYAAGAAGMDITPFLLENTVQGFVDALKCVMK
ncbi:MAG: glycosyltransferase family 4 protein [Solobacterium sp.]|nr:glycosyltransferase family 4 protein [Solobacterium sp.]